jgi:hypothetical protein
LTVTAGSLTEEMRFNKQTLRTTHQMLYGHHLIPQNPIFLTGPLLELMAMIRDCLEEEQRVGGLL